MNMETNTLICVGFALATAFFAYKYVSQRMATKFANLERSIQESRDTMWRDQDDLREQIDNLTRRVDCCSKQKSSCTNQGSVSY